MLAHAAAERTSVDPLSLPVMQQAALLQMHESHVKRTLIARLLEDAQDRPGLSDYRALVELGWAELKVGKRFHDLTIDGLIRARELQQALCQRFGVHLLLGPTGGGHSVRFSCPCGWSASVRNSHTAFGNGNARFRAHVATARAGLKRPQMAEG